MSSTRIEHLIDNAQAAFDRLPTGIESELDVDVAEQEETVHEQWRLPSSIKKV